MKRMLLQTELKPQKYAHALKEGGVDTRSCYVFFSGCVTNFLKCFAVRAVRNAPQPQISVIDVVSNLI